MKIILFLFWLGILFIIQTNAQQVLSHFLSPAEQEEFKTYNLPLSLSGITVPPGGSLRTAAEWEEIESIVITWAGYADILTEIVRHSIPECEVIIITGNETQVRTYLETKNIDPDDPHITYLIRPYNSVWVRDYGQWCVYRNDVDSLLMVDWIYNRPRPKDDTIPAGIAELKGFSLYQTIASPYHLVNTGGNFMCDGMGTAFDSELVLVENTQSYYAEHDIPGEGHNYTAIANILSDFMGIDRLITMPVLPYDGIHHIDMHMKLLDEETLLVGQYPEGVADGPQIEANLQYILDNYNSAFGTPYKVVRIPMPPDNGYFPNTIGSYRTYANNVFMNKTVLVPTYEEQFDTIGLRILRENLPGYNVVGIDCNDIIPAGGALHCITKDVMVADPLRIIHQPLDAQLEADAYELHAIIQHSSGIAAATIHYTGDVAAGFIAAPLSYSGADDIWSGEIAGIPGAEKIYYYLSATALSGKEMSRPITAPGGYYSFNIEAVSGVNETARIEAFTVQAIYPNPASAITVIPAQFPVATDVEINLLDMSGRLVKRIASEKVMAGNHHFFLHCEYIIPSSYIVEIKSHSGAVRQKLMVK